MAIPTPTVTEQWDRRGGNAGDDATVTKTRGFTVNFGSVTGCSDSEKQTLESAAVAAVAINRWDAHPADPRATCRSVSVKPDGGPHVWQIDYTYSSAPLQGKEDSETSGPDSPAGNEKDTPAQNRAPTTSVSWRTKTKIMEKDANGTDCVNSAGDGFDPPIEKEQRNPTYTLTFFRLPANLNWSVRRDFVDTVNDAEITIFGLVHEIGTLRCTAITPTSVWDTGDAGALKLFYQIVVEWEHDPDGWDAEVLDQGRREKIVIDPGPPEAFEMRQITDDTGQPPADPVMLGGDGLRKPPDTAPQYRNFVRYPSSNFTNHYA